MAIQSSELIWRKPASVSDTPASNGGRMTTTAIASASANALFPDVTQAQRSAGATTFRKAFVHVASADDVAFLSAQLYISEATAGDDFITLHEGTQTDTEDEVTARAYGAAALNTDVSASASSINVVPDGLADLGSLAPFQAGDTILITDGTNTETHTVATVTDNTTYLTLALDGTTLANAYTQAGGTVVSSVIEIASTKAAISSVVVSSTAGTLTSASLAAHNKGALNDAITLTFDSATTFNASGAALGSLGSGSTASTFSPTNAGTSSAYFTIPSTAWGGTFEAGDTVTFNLAPASIPLWYRRQVPAGADSLAGNSVEVSVSGESA